MEERRKFNRVKSIFEVKINIREEDQKKFLNSSDTVNLSACGVLIQNKKPIEVNTIINVQFSKLNSNIIFERIAKVSRIDKNENDKCYDIGIEFLDLTKEEENNLKNFLQNYKQEDQNNNEYEFDIEIPGESKFEF